MTLKDLISDILPALHPDDTVASALGWTEEYKVSHLPLVDSDGYYCGLVSEENLLDIEYENSPVKVCKLSVPFPYVYQNQPAFDCLSVMSQRKISVLPVLDLKNKYLGVITEREMIKKAAEITASNFEGGIIEISAEPINFSPAQIAAVIEANDMKMAGFYSKLSDDNKKIESVVKINGDDISPVTQRLESLGYTVDAVFGKDPKHDQLMKERFNAFVNYLDV